jgi:long-chain acyl-CoA synthetase
MTDSWVDRCIAVRRDRATLADLLDAPLAIDPLRTAIVFEGEELTYQELDERANRVANALIGLGVSPGDRVAVQLDNRPEFVEIFLGVMRAGAVIVPANVMYKAAEMQHLLADSGARVLFVAGALSSQVEPLVSELDQLEQIVEVGSSQLHISHSYTTILHAAATERPASRARPGDCAVIQYTSGTTGKSKGAVVSHANVLTAIDTIAALPRYPINDDSVTLLSLPLFHTFGLNFGAGLTFTFGLRMVLVNRFDAELVFSLIEVHRVTLFWGVPPMYFAFVNTPGLEAYDVSSLQHAMTGAALLPEVISERFRELTGVELADGYGASETSAILTFNTVGPQIKHGSVGPPYPGIEIRILDEHDQEVAGGEVGEICARGDNIFQGYWNQPEATAEAMRSGWFHTGDLGHVDEDGYVYIVDRKKDLIIVSGYNVYPFEIESVLLRHQKILDCAVIGIPDEYQGESVCAVVVPRSSEQLGEQEVRDYCRAHLAAFKRPKQVVIRDQIPKSAAGKVLKRVLRDEVTANNFGDTAEKED